MSAYYGNKNTQAEFAARAAEKLSGDCALLSLSTGIPVEILEAAQSLRSALPAEGAAWPAHFARSVRLGADLRHASYALLEWLLNDTRHGLVALAKSERTKALLRLLGAWYGKAALHGLDPLRLQPGGELILGFAFLKREVALWKNWKFGGLDDWRASRAALEIWKARELRPKDLVRALMAARAAWGDEATAATAQATALCAILGQANASPVYPQAPNR